MRTSLLFLADFAVGTTKPFANVFDRAADNTLRDCCKSPIIINE